MPEKRGRYTTRQQESVLAHMRAHEGVSLTVDEIHSGLAAHGVSVGRTTVYRALERLSADGRLINVPATDGGPARYCLMEEGSGTCLVCLGCYHVYPLDCEDLESFVRHVKEDHDFTVLPRRTVLYGYCPRCQPAA